MFPDLFLKLLLASVVHHESPNVTTALNHAEEDSIYRQIMQYWAPPVGLFAGSPQRMDTLFSAMVTRRQGQETGPVKSPAPAVKPIAD